MELCERLAKQRRREDALESAIACIDRFFETGLPEWELRDAEREFELTVDNHTLTGFIDAVYRRPSGENVVIDYKATQRTRDITEDTQLPLYLLACRELYGDSIA